MTNSDTVNIFVESSTERAWAHLRLTVHSPFAILVERLEFLELRLPLQDLQLRPVGLERLQGVSVRHQAKVEMNKSEDLGKCHKTF